MSDSEGEYVITRKRVGGGYKDVVTKKPSIRKKKKTKLISEDLTTEDESENEKQDYELAEKDGRKAELKLPIPREVITPDSCDGKICYDDYPILRYIQDNVIGHNLVINGPFGPKKVVYCDYTASGRAVTFIEDYIRNYVLPLYANTHSETGTNARQTQKFREEARSIIKRCVNAGKDDVVIFTGSGSTAGIHKLAWSLKINSPRVADETVVITGPFEHHSNVLIWKELGATLIRLKENDQGTVDLGMLERELKFWKEKKRLLLVSISAASNVTGIINDTDEVARIAHRHGALAAFDFAGGGPYLKIDVNSSKQSSYDAVYISPHKFVGGPGSPGILVAKKWMFKNQIPDRVGGGTVVYVTRDTHSYSSNIEVREEGGTPAIIESIRTGLAFLLKDAVTEHVIMSRDEDLCCRAFALWEQNPNLIILGNHNAERVTIFSFIVKHQETRKFLHFNFISTLLNDLFGIQSRGGCACAGPYVHDLLGITETMAKRLKWFVDETKGKVPNMTQSQLAIMRPGFVRVNLPYFYDDETVYYIIKSVDMVATHGWKLLPKYRFEPSTGNFKYKGHGGIAHLPADDSLFSLQDIDCTSYGKFHINREPPKPSDHLTLANMMEAAENVFNEALDDLEDSVSRPSTSSRNLQDMVPKDRQKLRWFMTPQEVIHHVTGSRRLKQYKPIMVPKIDFKEKEWNSAPESYTRRESGIPDNHSKRATENDVPHHRRKLNNLPSVVRDKIKEKGSAGKESENIYDIADNFKSNTARENYTKHQPKRHINYDSDSEAYLIKNTTTKINRRNRSMPRFRNRNGRIKEQVGTNEDEKLENTWPNYNKSNSQPKRIYHDKTREPSHNNPRSEPTGRYDDFFLPVIG